MSILAGFHVEGNDYLILRAFTAKILQLPEEKIKVDPIDPSGRGWAFILNSVSNALHRFYGQCAQFAVIGVDNDGNIDLDANDLTEDPSHPRHSNHPDQRVAECRYCQLEDVVTKVRPRLSWLPKKPGHTWPILIAVPVELIETWLLLCQGNLDAQKKPRSIQKQQLYGKPTPTRDDIENVAIPLIRSMTPDDVAALANASPSFRDFHDQLINNQTAICGPTDCW